MASQAEKDYEQLEKIVTNLVLFASSRQPSQAILSEVISKLAAEIAQSSNQISPYRLRLAYKIDELMKVISARLIFSADSEINSDYQSLVNELQSRIKLLSEQFNRLLRARQEGATEINSRVQEISSLTRGISDLHRDISNRDADITTLRKNAQELIELAQGKQSQIERLQNSISDLQADIQSSKEIDQRKESRITDLLNEKSQLNFQKEDLQRQYQKLDQQYQQKQIEIDNLKKQLEDLSEVDRVKSQNSTRTTPHPPVKPIATKKNISVEEYQGISNQGEYEYVTGYPNGRSGKWVNAYYRRPRRKNRWHFSNSTSWGRLAYLVHAMAKFIASLNWNVLRHLPMQLQPPNH